MPKLSPEFSRYVFRSSLSMLYVERYNWVYENLTVIQLDASECTCMGEQNRNFRAYYGRYMVVICPKVCYFLQFFGVRVAFGSKNRSRNAQWMIQSQSMNGPQSSHNPPENRWLQSRQKSVRESLELGIPQSGVLHIFQPLSKPGQSLPQPLQRYARDLTIPGRLYPALPLLEVGRSPWNMWQTIF